MSLNRVTITGADDTVRPSDLADLSRRFPSTEWGILVSRSQQGNHRFPTDQWLHDLCKIKMEMDNDGLPFNLSLHVCGRWVRQLLLGINELPEFLLPHFQRIQFNFHGERSPCHPKEILRALQDLMPPPRQYIFQVDGVNGGAVLQKIESNDSEFNGVALFDLSGGNGVLPDLWPAPRKVGVYQGYAGGLGPYNLKDQIQAIAEACGDETPHWIDMETRVRSHGDDKFDLGKVEHCLEIADPFVVADE